MILLRSKILFKCGISLIVISIVLILTYAFVIEAPAIVTCSPVILMVIGIIIAVMGGKKVIVNENYIVFLEKKIPLNNISHIMISYPFIEIKTNQLKSNRWLIDYNLDLIENLEKYIETVKIENKNLIETAELFQNVFKNKSFEKEDIHSIFREKDKFIIILKNKKVLKIKVSHSLMESIY